MIAIIPIILTIITTALAIWKKHVILLWWKKLKLRLGNSHVNIAIAIKHVEGKDSGHYHNAMISIFKEKVSQLGIKKLLKFTIIAPIFSDEEAKNYLKEADLNMIIWGTLGNDHLKERNHVIHKPILHIVFDTSSNQKKHSNVQFPTLDSVVDEFYIRNEESSIDVSNISKNIIHDSITILSVILQHSYRFNDAIKLLESLKKTNLTPKQLSEVQKEILKNHYYLAKEHILENKNYDAAIEHSKIVLKGHQNKHLDCLTILAFAYWHIGEENKSKNTVGLMDQYFPGDLFTYLNKGFFSIIKKEYTKATGFYKVISKRDNPYGPWVNNSINMLYDTHKSTAEIASLFAIGILSVSFGDATLGKAELENFIQLSQNNEVYNYMRKFAINFLSSTKYTAK